MKYFKDILTVLISFLTFGVVAQNSSTDHLVAGEQYILPSNLTPKDYLGNTLVLKVKSQFRNISSKNGINSSIVNQVLSKVGIVEFGKKFSNHNPPEKKYNELGQAYADLSLIYELKFAANTPIQDVINQLLATSVFDFVEPHFIGHSNAYTPNDPSIASQSHLTVINAKNAWDLGLGGSQGTASVVIGIVDAGSDMDHPDLVTQFVHNSLDPINGLDDDGDGYIDNYTGYDLAGADYNNIVGDNNPDVLGSNNGHGVHVSGCAAAATDNSIGVAGVGFNCKLLPVKCSADNGGAFDVIMGYEGITYAADHGAKIITCAWGMTTNSAFEQLVIDYATVNKNCLVVAAAGNDGTSVKYYPASYNYVLSISSTQITDQRSSFSSYNYDVDISAPGQSILSTAFSNIYSTYSGTSQSSAITAGGAGLVQSKFNYTNALQIGQRLKQTSDNIYSIGSNAPYQDKLGKGRLNLYRALTDPGTPSVVFANQTIVDHNDNDLVVGDSLFITGDFVNYLDPTSSLSATISAVGSGTTYVLSVDNTTSIGVVNTLSSVNNNSDPFMFKVKPGTPNNTTVTFKVSLSDGTYSDNYYFDVVLLSIPVASYTISSPKCVGSPISFTDQSSGTPTSWAWTFPGGTPASSTAQNPVVTYSTSGTKTSSLIATNASGSSAPLTNTFVVNSTPTITVNSGSITSGQSFTMTPSGANTYTFSSGLAVVSPTVTTSYTVTGTSTQGCVSNGVVSNVTVTPACVAPTLTITGGGNFCPAQTKTLTATGTASTYSWMPGGVTTSSIVVSPTITTVYTLTASNGGTCTSTYTVQLTANSNPVLSTNASPAAICPGGSSNLTAGGATTYTWSNGALTNTTVVTPTVTSTYTVIGKSVVGCTSTKTLAVTVNTSPTITVNSGTICAGNSFTITPSGASTYTYSGGSAVVSPTSTSSYTITGAIGSCTSSAVSTVTVNATPTITVNSGGICAGNSYTINASGANTYTWNTGATTNSIVVTPTTTTNYSVVGSSTLGCVSSASAISTVTVSSTPTLVVNSGSICIGNSFTMTPSGASTYTYSSGSAIVSPTVNATYTVTGSSAFGCLGSVVVSSVSVNASPTLSITSNPSAACLGNTVTLTASGATTYTWNTGAVTNTLAVSPSVNTVYTVTGTTTGCSATKTISVNPIDIVLSSTVTNIACNVSVNSGSISLLPSGGTFPYYYSWSNGATTANIKNLAIGSYSVLVSDANGCVDSLQLTVTRPTSLTVNTTIVSPACGVNDGQISATVGGGTSPYTYIWNSGATTPVASSLTPGQYIVQVYDASNCYGSAIVNLNPTNGPVVTVGTTNSVSCYGGNNGSTSISISGGIAPVTTQWSNGSTSNSLSGLSAGVYDVLVSDASGCNVNQTIIINQPNGLNVQPIVTRPNCTQSNGAISLNISGGQAPFTFTWSTNAGSASTQNVNGIASGYYNVTIGYNGACTQNIGVGVSDLTNIAVNVVTVTPSSCTAPTGSIDITAVNGVPSYSFSWSNGATTEDITNVFPGNYFVTVTDADLCKTSTSIFVSSNIFDYQPEICLISVDTSNNTNYIVWQKNITYGVEKYKIYRESSVPNNFQFVADVPFSALSEYTDLVANADVHSWRYRLSSVDSCGYEIPSYVDHKTIYLDVTFGATTNVLTWNYYAGFTYNKFYISRYDITNGWQLYDSTATGNIFTYTDILPPATGEVKYLVEAKAPFSCIPQLKTAAQTSNKTKSNVKNNNFEVITKLQDALFDSYFFIAPNPAKDELFVNFNKPLSRSTRIRVTDLIGKALFELTAKDVDKVVIPLKEFTSGLYFIQIENGKNTIVKKFVKE